MSAHFRHMAYSIWRMVLARWLIACGGCQGVHCWRFLPYAISHGPYAVALAALFVTAGGLSPAAAAVRMAVLPFQNVSGHVDGPKVLMPAIEGILRHKGYELLEREPLEAFLFEHRVRNTGMLSTRLARLLAERHGVQAILVGSIDLYRDLPDNPQLGLSARLVSPERGILWSLADGLTGDEFTTVFLVGTIRSPGVLAGKLAARAFEDLPGPSNLTGERSRGPGAWRLFRGGPRSVFRAASLADQQPVRVAVLPFENATERKGAAIITTDVLLAELARHTRFRPVELGDTVEALLELKAAPYGAIDVETLRGLREKTGAEAAILGTVQIYDEGIRRQATTSPEVGLDARMLDTRTGRILWMAYHEANGDDTQIALDFGRVRSMVPLLRKVIREMLDSL